MSTSCDDGADRVLDLVGDVRNHLHGAAEVVAAPLLLNDATGRSCRSSSCEFAVVDGVGEALVVAEVEVGLGAVVGDVDLAVLIRAHRAGIDVDVRVELLQRDRVAVAFEEAADRRRRQSLAERGHHAAGDEDVFGGSSVRHDHRSARCRRRRAGARTCSRSSGVSDADRFVVGLDRLDADAVLERPQLFERFGALERRRLERGQHQQRAAAIRVEADMSIERRPAAARVADVQGSAPARNTARSRRGRRRP